MKNIIITARRRKVELVTLLVCFVLANLLNIYAVVTYNTPMTELFTSLGYVVVTTFVLYILWTLIRFVIYGIGRIFRKQ